MSQENKQEVHLESVSKSIENFTVDFHKCIAEKIDGNFASSALSAHTLLSMAAYGAEGTTKDLMRKSLHLPENNQLAHQEFQSLIDIFNTVENIVLKVANKIYAANRIKINEKYKEITSSYFRSESEIVDFSKNVIVANVINKWCAEQTNDKIANIVGPEMLNDFTGMLLLNAVYFKGDWQQKFSKSATDMKPFHVNKTTTIEVPTMFVREYFYYEQLEEVNAEVVGLPYQNEDFYMLIIVPNEIDGLKNLEKNLEQINLDFQDISRRHIEICLNLPKFKVETKIDLNSILTELGMSEIFSDKANFSGIANESLKVDKVMQKVFIEVNEDGSEAAAVTCGSFMLCSSRPLPPPSVVVDRPFLYKIIHKNCTLFSGRIVNPLES